MPACIITQCVNRYSNSSTTKFFKVPSWTDSFQATRRHLWARAIEGAGFRAHWWTGHICGAHFLSGSVSLDADSDDFVPSLFRRVNEPPTSLVQNKDPKDEEGITSRKRKWKRPCQTTEAEGKKTKKGAGDSTLGLCSVVLRKMEPLSKATTIPEKRKTLPKCSKDETKPDTVSERTTFSSSSINPADFTECIGRPSVVLLKRLTTSTGSYRCEKCYQIFTLATQLVKHIRLHEGHEESFMCEICGENYTSQADLSAHQANHPKIEPGFLCDICKQCFITPETLKNHKLLHFKDDQKKCLKWDVKLCSQHSHVTPLPGAEAKVDNEKKASTSRLLTLPSHQIQEQRAPEKIESFPKEELLKITVSSSAPSPALILQLPSRPPILLSPHPLPPLSSSRTVTLPFPFPTHTLTSPPRIVPSPSVNMSPPNVSKAPSNLHKSPSAALDSLTTSDQGLPSINTPPVHLPQASDKPAETSLDFSKHTPQVGCDKSSQIKKSRSAATEEETSAAADSSHDILSPNTRKCEISQEQNEHTPATPKENEKLSTGSDTRQLQSTAASCPSSMTYSQVIADLRRKKSVVLLRRLIPSAGGYQCEKCCQTFTTTSLLVRHMSLHEGKSSGNLELSGKDVTGQTDCTDHQINQPKIEVSYPCNICDRSFCTPQNLKRHKLLHVKDSRKCLKCGVMFCRRHNHVAFLPLVETGVEIEEELPENKPQNLLTPQTQDQGGAERMGSQAKPPPAPPPAAPSPAPPAAAPPVPSLAHIASVSSSSSLSPCPPPNTSSSGSPLPSFIVIHRSLPSSHSTLLSTPPAPPTASSSPSPLSTPLSQTRDSGPNVSGVKATTLKSSQASGITVMTFPVVLGRSNTFTPPPIPEPLAMSEELCTSSKDSNAHFDLKKLSNLPPSLKMFSPECLTSAFIQVERDYQHIVDKARPHQKKHVVKVEQPERPPVIPRKQSTKPQKVQRKAYDFEFII